MPPTAHVEDVDATVAIVDGRVAMNARASSSTLRVQAPDRRPLSEGESHATLRLADDDVRVAIDLDGRGLDALADAVAGIQERGRDD